MRNGFGVYHGENENIKRVYITKDADPQLLLPG